MKKKAFFPLFLQARREREKEREGKTRRSLSFSLT